MLPSVLNHLEEDIVAVSVVAPGHVDYYFLLAPTSLSRASLDGIVELDYEPSNLGVGINYGSNPMMVANFSPVAATLGVTWDTSPVTASGYSATTVSSMWTVQSTEAISVRAPAIGVSIGQTVGVLRGMGYDLPQLVDSLATVANPAVFILTDPTILSNLNSTLSYRSYVLAIVPSDELDPGQHSLSLYLQLQGVVYNTSYYFGACQKLSLLPGCPVFIAEAASFVSPGKYLPTQLQGLIAVTPIQTTGFLTGTTVKTIAQYAGIGGLSGLAKLSPIDVGLYDMGYSDGTTGYNLPTLYFTWGTGPTWKLSNNDSIGLYVPARAIESAWDLSNVYTQVSGLPWNQSSLALFESDVKSAYQYVVSNSPFNGSSVVPGVYFMVESWANSSPGFVLAGLTGAGIEGCPIDLLETCLVSNISLSANAGSVFFPPEIIGVSTNLTGSSYTYSGFLTTREVW
jgi:hypothetical protein